VWLLYVCCCRAQAVPQPGFILQPFLRGLVWESHLFFARGEFLYQIATKQYDRSKTFFSCVSTQLSTEARVTSVGMSISVSDSFWLLSL
jgi:hypothetical protein